MSEADDSISKARKLLAKVVCEDDSLPPTSQDILSVCSGKFNFETKSDGSHDNDDFSPRFGVVSTPVGRKVSRLFADYNEESPYPYKRAFFEKDLSPGFDASGESFGSPANNEIVKKFAGKKRYRLISESDDEEEENETTVATELSEKTTKTDHAEKDGEDSDQEEDDEEEEVDADEDEEEDEEIEENESGVEDREGCSQSDLSERDNDDARDGEEDEEEAYARRERENKQYFDDEAELSGDDDGRDDNEDETAENKYEEEAGDLDDLPEDGELRDQIGRIHWKKMMDEDKRKLLRYKEAYLRDESDALMKYRFRWKRPDNDDDTDNFHDGPTDDGVVTADVADEFDVAYQESMQLKTRFLVKHGISVEDALAETADAHGDSQLLKFGKVALNRTISLSSERSMDQSQSNFSSQGPVFFHHSVSEAGNSGSSFFRRGSLLSRASSILEKLSNENNSTALFYRKKTAVFTMLSPTKDGDDDFEDVPGNKRIMKQGPIPSTKRVKLHKDTSQSIFGNLN